MRISLPTEYHRWLYVIGLAGIAAGLSINKVVLSIGVIWIGVNWLWEGNFAAKWRIFTARKSVFFLIAIFLLHVIGLMWTPDFNDGLRDVRIKIPLLVVPLVIGTSEPLQRKQFEALLIIFCCGVLFSTIRTYLIARGVIHREISDLRQASDLVALIRLSLFSSLSILLSARWIYRNTDWSVRILCAVFGIWLIWFMVYMQSVTGLTVLVVSGFVVMLRLLLRFRNRRMIALSVLFAVIGLLLPGYYVMRAYNDFYSLRGNEIPALQAVSPTGRPYKHYLDVPIYENGNKVLANVCWGDMMLAWNTRSEVDFLTGVNSKGGSISYALARYLASKGLSRDSVGMSKLTDAELREIELGATNYKDKERNALELRAYQIFWEMYNYMHGGDPSGSSVTTRLEVIRATNYTIAENFWSGTGTGGQTPVYQKYYANHPSKLHESYHWFHAHNQFLSIAVTLGVPAGLFFLFTLWWPAFTMRRWKSFLYLAFFIIVALSFLDDDTLETQQGVTFFAFFNALLLYAMPSASAVTAPSRPAQNGETEVQQ